MLYKTVIKSSSEAVASTSQLPLKVKTKAKPGSEGWPASPQRCPAGFTLVEVMLVIAVLSLTAVPFALTLTQSGITAKKLNVVSSRGLVNSSRFAEAASLQQATFSSNYTDGSNRSITESGYAIPTLSKVPPAGDGVNPTDIFNRMTYLYLYDQDGSTLLRRGLAFQGGNTYRLSANHSSNIVDNAGNFWATDSGSNLYNVANVQPGPLAAYSTDSQAGSITNVSGYDGAIFQTRAYTSAGSPVNYAFPVPNGAYTVKLFSAEISSTANNTNHRRLGDITLGGTVSGSTITGGNIVNTTPYSPYESTQGTFLGNVLMYDTYVSNGVLTISINDTTRAPSQFFDGNMISAIEIRKRAL
jgi:prepilin-type N-terminal cleavage/methylation domain-containing protein